MLTDIRERLYAGYPVIGDRDEERWNTGWWIKEIEFGKGFFEKFREFVSSIFVFFLKKGN